MYLWQTARRRQVIWKSLKSDLLSPVKRVAIVKLMNSGKLWFLAKALLTSAALLPGPRAFALERWFYVSQNLWVDQNITNVLGWMQRASQAGYTHVLLNDSKFSRLATMDAHYFRNLNTVKQAASNLNLEIVPALFPGTFLWCFQPPQRGRQTFELILKDEFTFAFRNHPFGNYQGFSSRLFASRAQVIRSIKLPSGVVERAPRSFENLHVLIPARSSLFLPSVPGLATTSCALLAVA